MTQERTPQASARASTDAPSLQRPGYLPALAFVGVVIAFQNLAIRSDSAPDPFLRPALSVTQAFRLPPEETALPLAPEGFSEPTGTPWSFSATDFRSQPTPGASAPTGGIPSASDPIGAAILETTRGDPISATGPSPRTLASAIAADLPATPAEAIAASLSAVDAPAPAPADTLAVVASTAPIAPGKPATSTSPDQAPATPSVPPVHEVHRGDTLWSIARNRGIPIDILRAMNPGIGSVLRVGTRLLLDDRQSTEPRAARSPGVAPSADGEGFVYTVRVGDTLSSVARRFEVPLATLVIINGIQNYNHLSPGMEIRISRGASLEHPVGKGESLWSISRLYDLTVAEVAAHNKLASETLKPGQILKIPTRGLDAEHFERILERRRIAKRSWVKPIEGRITDQFGMRTHPILNRKIQHRGVDFAAHTGTSIRVSRGGVVSFSGWLEGYGRIVEVRHGEGYSTRYAHCSKLLVKKGQKVQKGTIIAKVGSSGLATAPHVHFELRRNGVPKDPLQYL